MLFDCGVESSCCRLESSCWDEKRVLSVLSVLFSGKDRAGWAEKSRRAAGRAADIERIFGQYLKRDVAGAEE